MINETSEVFGGSYENLPKTKLSPKQKNHNCKAIIRPLKEEVLKLFSERSREERRTGPSRKWRETSALRPVRP